MAEQNSHSLYQNGSLSPISKVMSFHHEQRCCCFSLLLLVSSQLFLTAVYFPYLSSWKWSKFNWYFHKTSDGDLDSIFPYLLLGKAASSQKEIFIKVRDRKLSYKRVSKTALQKSIMKFIPISILSVLSY